MREGLFKGRSMLNKRGITLIELLIAFVMCAIVIGGIYRVYIAQTKAYTVQDQVVEVQQSIRGAMEIIERDLRMAGFQTSSFGSAAISNTPIVTPLNDTSITVNYEYIPSVGNPTVSTVTYALAGTNLTRTFNGVQDPLPLLSNVTNLNFSYGIDQDKAIDDNDFVPAANVGTARVVAVRVSLTAGPEKLNAQDDRFKMVQPRTLDSTVTLRNMCIRRSQAY